jgi:hypothetical protein
MTRRPEPLGEYCAKIPPLGAPVTQPEHCGRGMGTRLIQAVYAAAQSAASSRVYWSTQTTNTDGSALYDKVAKHLGFVVYTHELWRSGRSSGARPNHRRPTTLQSRLSFSGSFPDFSHGITNPLPLHLGRLAAG